MQQSLGIKTFEVSYKFKMQVLFTDKPAETKWVNAQETVWAVDHQDAYDTAKKAFGDVWIWKTEEVS